MKVGDKVKVIADLDDDPCGNIGKVGIIKEVDSHPNWPYEILLEGATHTRPYGEKELKLVSSPSHKVIGYKLLKDLPWAKVGSQTIVENGWYKFFPKSTNAYSDTDLSDTTWFEPIYEQEKVVVELSNGKVEIEEGNVKFISPDNHYYNYHPNQVKKLHKSLTNILPSNGFGIQVLTFKVGCQTFTIEDLDKVLAAIPTI